jgi:sarcosine/dimethylglycine N-methyltransferase
MSTETAHEAVDIARDYYNSEDADHFYSTVWGGEDIHIGIYISDNDPVYEASQRTQERMLKHIDNPGKRSKVIDLGSGYGGSARYLAKRFGCEVTAYNLSEVENERARELNRKQNLDNLIDVVDGYFEELPYDDKEFDLAWSQDAFLHSPDREQVIKEAARVLKPGGEFVFTDPMQSDDCPDGVLQPILDRIHLESMASPGF